MRALSAIGAVLVISAVIAGVGVHESLLRIPARWLPPDLNQPPGALAHLQLNGATAGRLSQHATANAIDIAAFHLEDGRTVSVLADYGKPTPAGKFLDDAHEAACGLFNIVLGPKFNRLHANHFHLDMGPFRF